MCHRRRNSDTDGPSSDDDDDDDADYDGDDDIADDATTLVMGGDLDTGDTANNADATDDDADDDDKTEETDAQLANAFAQQLDLNKPYNASDGSASSSSGEIVD